MIRAAFLLLSNVISSDSTWKLGIAGRNQLNCQNHKSVVSFSLRSGFVTDEEVKQRELKLRDALKVDGEFRVKDGASVEVAQVGAA